MLLWSLTSQTKHTQNKVMRGSGKSLLFSSSPDQTGFPTATHWFHTWAWGLCRSSTQALRSCIPSFCPSQGCHAARYTSNKNNSPLPHPVLKAGIQEALQRWHLLCLQKCLASLNISAPQWGMQYQGAHQSPSLLLYSLNFLPHPYSCSLHIYICCKITSMAVMPKIYPAKTSWGIIPIADETSIFDKYLSANTTGFQFICLQKIAVSIRTNSKTFWTANTFITLWCWVIPTLTTSH